MIRVLFVDDEVDVLEGLENRLRKYRKRWKMSFAVGARSALEQLEQTPADVVVTDMRMPGMDGVELLTRVREIHPRAVRIVLSGQTEKEQLLRMVALAHRYLSKPVEASDLERAIEGAREIGLLLEHPELQEVISRVKQLPSVPRVFQELSSVLERPDASVADVARIVESDAAMTARLLQMVSSGFFGLGRAITSAHEAVSYLGLNLVRAIVLTSGLFESLQSEAMQPGFSLDTLQRHGLLTGRLASRILGDGEASKLAFSAGMLHDIGSLVLATSIPDYYGPAVEHAVQESVPLHQAETAVHGFCHAEVGGALLATWGLPFTLVDVVTQHHRPDRASADTHELVTAVHVADHLAHEVTSDRRLSGPPGPLEGLCLDCLPWTEAKVELPRWRQMARELVSQSNDSGTGSA